MQLITTTVIVCILEPSTYIQIHYKSVQLCDLQQCLFKGQIVRGYKSGWLSSPFLPPLVVRNKWFLGTGWDLLYPSVVRLPVGTSGCSEGTYFWKPSKAHFSSTAPSPGDN